MNYTIKDIAAELGVSITTVSLIINNRPCRVSEKTRKDVLDLVKKYNYTPNSSARALVTKKTETIGLIVPDISNPFFSELAKGVERAAQKANYSVILCNSDNKAQKDIKNTALLISKQVDGLILAPSMGDQDVEYIAQFNRLTQRNRLPLVLADRTVPFGSYNSVLIDNRIGAYQATCHLLELGHRKIGCVTGPLNVDSAEKRYNGYIDALRMNDIEVDEDIICHGDYQVESGFAAAEPLLNKGVTAIFACNDLMALGCMRKARQMGMIPGKDISIMGFDDIPLCELLDQPLTTVRQPLYEMGKHSFQLIKDLIDKPQSRIENIMLPPTVIVRDTTTQCKNQKPPLSTPSAITA